MYCYDKVACDNHDLDRLGGAEGITYQFVSYQEDEDEHSDHDEEREDRALVSNGDEDASEREDARAEEQHSDYRSEEVYDNRAARQSIIPWQVAAPLANSIHFFLYRRGTASQSRTDEHTRESLF